MGGGSGDGQQHLCDVVATVVVDFVVAESGHTTHVRLWWWCLLMQGSIVRVVLAWLGLVTTFFPSRGAAQNAHNDVDVDVEDLFRHLVVFCFFFFLVVLLPGGGGSSVGGCSLAEPIGNSRANLLGPKSVQTGQALRLVTRSGRVFRTSVVVRVGESGLCVAASELCVFKLKRGSE